MNEKISKKLVEKTTLEAKKDKIKTKLTTLAS
jgi:hypothetical protein